MTEQTHALAFPHVSGDIAFRDRGEVEVKGSAKPLRMYLAISKQVLQASQGLTAAGVDLNGNELMFRTTSSRYSSEI